MNRLLTMKDIVREGHESLRIKADQVELPASEEDKTLLTKMLQFIKNSQDEEIEKRSRFSGSSAWHIQKNDGCSFH